MLTNEINVLVLSVVQAFVFSLILVHTPIGFSEAHSRELRLCIAAEMWLVVHVRQGPVRARKRGRGHSENTHRDEGKLAEQLSGAARFSIMTPGA